MKESIYWAGCLLACFVAGCGSAPASEDSAELSEALTSYTLSGRILTADQLGVAGVKITLSGKASKTATTDANGNYSFAGLAQGSYTVAPSKTSCSFAPSNKTLTLSANTAVNFTGSGGGCVVSATFNKEVYALIYNPTVIINGVTQTLAQSQGWGDPTALINQYSAWLKTTSSNRINYTVVTSKVVNGWPTKTDGFNYNQTSYFGCDFNNNTAAGCHVPEDANYLKFITDNQLCEKLNAGTIDEVWLMGGPQFGFHESTLAGPANQTFGYNSGPVTGTTCQKLLPIMGFNYKSGLPDMVHDFGHRIEATMARVYGGWQTGSLANTWDKFRLVAAEPPSLGYSGCGGIHNTPTSVAGAEYIYDNAGPASSFCDDFLGYPTLHTPSTVLKPTGCSAWGCSDIGYYAWWLKHMPKVPGFGADDKLADWWRYAVDPNQVFVTDNATCSSEYEPGWCQGVADGTHGECNSGEWATAGLSTGWVQLNFRTPRTATSVTVYDRACDEQVTSGHVQLSDGTILNFGALENTGVTGTKLTFSSRQLNWVKVFIDGSTGGNVGISEITVP